MLGIAAPASPFDRELFSRGIDVLKKMGFDVFHRPDIFAEERYLAGTDERRTNELEELFANPEISAILFARGGYGTQRILPKLDLKKIKKNPKPVIGCSDLTPLLQVCSLQGSPVFYGPVVTLLGKNPTELTLQTLKNTLLEGRPAADASLASCHILKPGKARGRLIGGCLSLITSSLKTPYSLEPKGDILFFEDVGEKTYVLDRKLTQLQNSGFLKKCSGILVGSLTPREKEAHSVEEMLKNCLADFDGPVVTNFPAGHTENFHTLPLNTPATLDTTHGTLVF